MESTIEKVEIEFNKNDFIELFLYNLIINGINKIDIFELKYDLIEFYDNAYYKELFLDMPLHTENDEYYIELDECINNANLNGFLSNPIKDSNDRLIFLEDPNKIYTDEIEDKMASLVNEYILKIKKNINLLRKISN